MLIAIGQLLLAAIGCAALFVAYRLVAREEALARIVGAGVILRALLGQALFWISYLELPIARSLQLGGGFWFFGEDGVAYFARAAHVKAFDPSVISPLFVQIVALARTLFGAVPSIALLLNLFAFLGTSAVIAVLGRRAPRVAAIGAAAISFSPALIVWSTQLLKDNIFVFLLAAFVGAASWWMRSPNVAATAALSIALAAIGGIRWYVLLALLLTAFVPLASAALRSRARLRGVALLVTMYAVVLAAVMWTAGPFMPAAIRNLTVAPTAARVAKAPRMALNVVEGARIAFAAMPASTTIVAGARVASMKPAAARLASGVAALVLPLPIARVLGLCDVRGGRGLLAFVAVDTLLFDAMAVFAVVAFIRASRRGPLFWLVAGPTLVIAVVVAYCVTNYGSLVRYRSMAFIGVVLAGLAAHTPLPESEEETARNSSRRSSSIDQSHMYIRS